MKLDSTKIVVLIVGTLLSFIGATVGYIGVLIRDDIRVVKEKVVTIETRMNTITETGGFDFVADMIADKDSLTQGDRELIKWIIENSE